MYCSFPVGWEVDVVQCTTAGTGSLALVWPLHHTARQVEKFSSEIFFYGDLLTLCVSVYICWPELRQQRLADNDAGRVYTEKVSVIHLIYVSCLFAYFFLRISIKQVNLGLAVLFICSKFKFGLSVRSDEMGALVLAVSKSPPGPNKIMNVMVKHFQSVVF